MTLPGKREVVKKRNHALSEVIVMNTENTQSNNEPFMIVVETWRDGNWRESVRTIDYSNRENRVWLAKHSFWALKNNRSVVTYPANNEFRFSCGCE